MPGYKQRETKFIEI